MNKGTKKYVVRIPDDLIYEIQETIASRNEATKDGVWNFSDYVRNCIIKDLAHRERSKGLQATRRTITLAPALTLEAE